jgi:hypothetical protein
MEPEENKQSGLVSSLDIDLRTFCDKARLAIYDSVASDSLPLTYVLAHTKGCPVCSIALKRYFEKLVPFLISGAGPLEKPLVEMLIRRLTK